MLLTPTMIMPWTGILGKQMGFLASGFLGFWLLDSTASCREGNVFSSAITGFYLFQL